MKKEKPWHAKWRREAERVLHVSVSRVWHVLNLMACFFIRRRMILHSNLHTKRAPLFRNCHKAVLSIAHHSREAQMALTLSASQFNWGITGKYVDHFRNYLWICMRDASAAAILFFFSAGTMKTKHAMPAFQFSEFFFFFYYYLCYENNKSALSRSLSL